YAVGGHVTNSRSENQRYNGTSWESKASVYARSGPGVAAYDGKLYVFGGNHSSTILSRFDIYDPTADSWSYGGEMPAVAEPWRATTLGDKIYVYASGYVDSKKLWCYDPIAHTWDTSIPLMNVPRDSAELQAVNGRVYAIGGTNSSDGILSSVESWAPGETSWTMEPSLNIARKTFASAAIGNHIYVFGGQNENGNLGSTEVLTICEPDPDCELIPEEIASMSDAHSGAGVVSYEGKLYVWTGYTNYGPSHYNRTVKMEIYDPDTDTWSRGSDVPQVKALQPVLS
ncbi:unnamed protein product, partial [marine sediment metagenome]